MTTSYAVSATITQAGIQAAISSGLEGPTIQIVGFTIGSLSAAEGSVALPTDTSVDGLVYTGTTSQMGYSIVDQDTCIWQISLDTTVGNFEVGNIGIMLAGGILFAKAVLPGQSLKYMSDPPTTV